MSRLLRRGASHHPFACLKSHRAGTEAVLVQCRYDVMLLWYELVHDRDAASNIARCPASLPLCSAWRADTTPAPGRERSVDASIDTDHSSALMAQSRSSSAVSLQQLSHASSVPIRLRCAHGRMLSRCVTRGGTTVEFRADGESCFFIVVRLLLRRLSGSYFLERSLARRRHVTSLRTVAL